ncbi:hypothetical protein C4D60_Mb09t15120 [Musa balbisiana]|uniref:Uncharacterized protein n=1 Tax=Musa balbisiana TaxID=52838 RepID=A0A4S8IGN2_MUSBA|nr:hypothetical protein C4D60_Mb09t15120 [Musa balbisiana]
MKSYKDGLKGYWTRPEHRGGGDQGRRRLCRAELGGGGHRRRFWRLKISPQLGFLRATSPQRILPRIRDAYVRMMLRFARATPLGVGYGGGGGGGGAGAVGFAREPLREYDEKVLVEIYKSLVADSANAGGAVALRP